MADDAYDRILKVSTRLMGMHSYHGTSISMIAEKAGVASSTVMYHFKSKERLLVAIMDENIPEITDNLIPIAMNQYIDGAEKLKRFINYQLNQIESRWDALNIFLVQSEYLDKHNRAKIVQMQIDYWKLVHQIIVQIQDEKRGFLDLDPKIVSIGIIGMMTWVGLWYRKYGKYNIPFLEESIYRIITDAVIDTQSSKNIKEFKRPAVNLM